MRALKLFKHRPRHGLTLVELMVVVGISALLMSLALPAMSGYIARQRVISTTNELSGALRYARSLPLQQRQMILVGFGRVQGSENFTCYAIYSSPGFASCSCTRWPSATCTTSSSNLTQPEAFKTVVVPRDSGITLSWTSSPTQYNALTGLPVNPSGGDTVMRAEVSSTNGGVLQVYINGTGLPSICAVSGHAAYPACTCSVSGQSGYPPCS